MPKIIDFSDVGFTSGAGVGAFKGCARDVPNQYYHSLKSYWSSGDLKYMHGHSPAHFQDRYFKKPFEEKEQTPAMVLGSLVHTLILTPNEFEKEFFLMPDLNLRTNEGKAAKQELLAANPGKTPVSHEMLAQANAMKSSCFANPKANELLLEGSKPELSFFWTCPFSHLNFRAKVDSSSSKYFVELKTTSSAEPETFARHAYNMNYDLSLVHYTEGIKSVFDVAPPPYFIVIEQDPPFVTQVYRIGDGFLKTGHEKWLAAVTRLADGVQKGQWPAYYPAEQEPFELHPPRWAMSKLEVSDAGI